MKSMKKILTILLALALSTSLAACQTGGTTPATSSEGGDVTASEPDSSEASADDGAAVNVGDERTLTLGHYVDPANMEDPSGVQMTKLFKQLSEENNMNIVIETIPWDQIEGKMIMTNQAGDPSADLYILSSQKLASVVNSGALTPLDDYIARDLNKDDFIGATFDAGTHAGDGKVYCILTSIHSRGLWYNKDLMPTAPTTRDELVQYAQAAMEANSGTFGFGFYGNQHYGSIEVTVGPYAWDAGTALCDASGKAIWANAEAADAIQFLSDCLNVHKITPESCITAPEYNEISDMFLAGNIASYIDGTYAVAKIQDSDLYKDGKIGFVPIPGKTGPAPNFSNGWAFGIPTNSKKADLAWEMVVAFEQPEMQTLHSSFEGGMPTRKASYDDPVFATGVFVDFLANLPNGRSMDPFVYYQEGLESISMAKSSYFMDPTQDLTALLQSAQDEFNNRFYK